MRVLGLGDHVSCGSALVEDGTVVAAITDERLVREKMVFGVPRASIAEILRMRRLEPGQIDAVAIATRNQHLIDGYEDFKDGWFGLKRGRFKQYLFEMASGVSKYRSRLPFLDTIYYGLRQPAFDRRRKALERILKEEFGLDCPVHFLDHHHCHVASAYYTSRFKDATVFSIDGGGDGRSVRIYQGRDGKLEPLGEVSSFNSLGTFYSYVTQICGFKAGRHEGKITGLAAFGEPCHVDALRKILVYEDGGFRNVANVFFLSALKELAKVLPPDFSHKDLAASIQVYAEELVTHLVRHWVGETGLSNVALAGGVMANVKINQRVHELPEVDAVYVHPGMSDEGMPVGAAITLCRELSGDTSVPSEHVTMRHVYLGPEYTDEEIGQALQAAGVAAKRFDPVEPEIARLLADGRVVARFNGRMEYGPRALGNRTILYQATDPSVHYWLNNALKRTEFMPFAPIVMTDHADRCFVNMKGAEDTARFMTITFDCTPWMAEHLPGVVHVDNTARPQLVSAEDNPSIYSILEAYHGLTGLPGLINTSFNMHEEPIVCTPQDGIRAFLLGHLDVLAMGNWIAENPEPFARDDDSSRFDQALERRGVVRLG